MAPVHREHRVVPRLRSAQLVPGQEEVRPRAKDGGVPGCTLRGELQLPVRSLQVPAQEARPGEREVWLEGGCIALDRIVPEPVRVRQLAGVVRQRPLGVQEPRVGRRLLEGGIEQRHRVRRLALRIGEPGLQRQHAGVAQASGDRAEHRHRAIDRTPVEEEPRERQARLHVLRVLLDSPVELALRGAERRRDVVVDRSDQQQAHHRPRAGPLPRARLRLRVGEHAAGELLRLLDVTGGERERGQLHRGRQVLRVTAQGRLEEATGRLDVAAPRRHHTESVIGTHGARLQRLEAAVVSTGLRRVSALQGRISEHEESVTIRHPWPGRVLLEHRHGGVCRSIPRHEGGAHHRLGRLGVAVGTLPETGEKRTGTRPGCRRRPMAPREQRHGVGVRRLGFHVSRLEAQRPIRQLHRRLHAGEPVLREPLPRLHDEPCTGPIGPHLTAQRSVEEGSIGRPGGTDPHGRQDEDHRRGSDHDPAPGRGSDPRLLGGSLRAPQRRRGHLRGFAGGDPELPGRRSVGRTGWFRAAEELLEGSVVDWRGRHRGHAMRRDRCLAPGRERHRLVDGGLGSGRMHHEGFALGRRRKLERWRMQGSDRRPRACIQLLERERFLVAEDRWRGGGGCRHRGGCRRRCRRRRERAGAVGRCAALEKIDLTECEAGAIGGGLNRLFREGRRRLLMERRR